MKNLFFIILFTLFSCADRDNEIPSVAYYRFTNSELLKTLPNTKSIKRIYFRNKINDTTSIKITYDYMGKTLDTRGMGFFTTYASSGFYYDRREISGNGQIFGRMEILFRKVPIDYENAYKDHYKIYPAIFRGQIMVMNLNNTSIYQSIPFEVTPTEFIAGNSIYKNVYKIGNDIPNMNYTHDNIKTVYYDVYEGIVGFDELNGNEWRKQ